MNSILNPAWKYVPAVVHQANPNYLRDKFRRMIAEQKKSQAEAAKKVANIKGRK